MKANTKILSFISNINFLLLSTTAGLITIHLTLISRVNDNSLLGNSLLFWIAVCSLIWQKRDTLNLESRVFSCFCGVLLIAVVLLKSATISGYDYFLRISPLISTLGVALLASGFRGLKQYWCELLILCFLVPSPGALALLIDISTLTAKFTTVLLWYTGFEVSRQGVFVTLPTGGIEVYPGCSGIESMLHLLGLSVLFLIMFPSKLHTKFIVPLTAISIAFIVNGLRVALMAILAASSSNQALEYWHKGDGSLIFSLISVGCLGLFCLFLLRQEDTTEEHDLMEVSDS